MISVNLLSPTVTFRRRQKARVRVWLIVVAVVAGLSAIPLGADLIKSAQAAALRRQVEPLNANVADARNRLDKVSAECRNLTTQLARADALRAKRDWAGLLQLIAGQIPPQVWLDSLETFTAEAPSRPTGSARNKQPKNQNVVIPGPAGMHIVGYATDNDWLYEFMSRLKLTGAFRTVELTMAGRVPVLQGAAVRFSLTCTW